MNRLRIVYILNATDPFGGATKAIMNLVEGLKDRISPLFIVPDASGITETFEQRGIPYRILDYRMSVYPPTEKIQDILLFVPRLIGRIYLNRKAAKQLVHIAGEFHADLIHTNTSVNNIGYLASRRLAIPHVWHIREYADLDFNFHYYPSRSSFIRQFKTPDSYTICITKDIRRYNELQEWSNSRVIYDGVLHEQQCRMIIPKERYFLFAGRFGEGKGIEDLLHAYADYVAQTQKPIPLRIAGDTTDKTYKDRLEQIVVQKGLSKQVTFLGMIDDVLSQMAHATALIVPSKAEGFGFITAEGMFSGALVIGRNTRGTKEQFDNGEQQTGEPIGLRYETQDELVELLTQVTQTGIAPYLTLIQRGQEVVKQLYSIESHQQAVYRFYQQIIQKPHKQ